MVDNAVTDWYLLINIYCLHQQIKITVRELFIALLIYCNTDKARQYSLPEEQILLLPIIKITWNNWKVSCLPSTKSSGNLLLPPYWCNIPYEGRHVLAERKGKPGKRAVSVGLISLLWQTFTLYIYTVQRDTQCSCTD